MPIKFTDLLKKHYGVKTNNGLSKKILETVELDMNILGSVRELELDKLLPDMNFIARSVNDGIVYMGRECEYTIAEIYQYDKYFVVFEFSGCGNEDDFNIDVLYEDRDGYTGSDEQQISSFLEDLNNHINVTETLTDKQGLDILNNANPLTLHDLITYYKNKYGDEGKANLLKYINDMYE